MIESARTKSFLSSDDQKDSPTELAFKYAVFRINNDPDVLPNNTIAYDIQYVPPEDSFRTTKKVNVDECNNDMV